MPLEYTWPLPIHLNGGAPAARMLGKSLYQLAVRARRRQFHGSLHEAGARSQHPGQVLVSASSITIANRAVVTCSACTNCVHTRNSYTIRELTNHVVELYALKALQGEVQPLPPRVYVVHNEILPSACQRLPQPTAPAILCCRC